MQPFVFPVQEDSLQHQHFVGKERILGFPSWEGLSFPTEACSGPNGPQELQALHTGWRMGLLARPGGGRKRPTYHTMGMRHWGIHVRYIYLLLGEVQKSCEPLLRSCCGFQRMHACGFGSRMQISLFLCRSGVAQWTSSHPSGSPLEKTRELGGLLWLKHPWLCKSSSPDSTYMLTGVRCASASSDGVPCGDFSLSLKENLFLHITMSVRSFPAQRTVLLNLDPACF